MLNVFTQGCSAWLHVLDLSVLSYGIRFTTSYKLVHKLVCNVSSIMYRKAVIMIKKCNTGYLHEVSTAQRGAWGILTGKPAISPWYIASLHLPKWSKISTGTYEGLKLGSKMSRDLDMFASQPSVRFIFYIGLQNPATGLNDDIWTSSHVHPHPHFWQRYFGSLNGFVILTW